MEPASCVHTRPHFLLKRRTRNGPLMVDDEETLMSS
jgi:hypothetical protein